MHKPRFAPEKNFPAPHACVCAQVVDCCGEKRSIVATVHDLRAMMDLASATKATRVLVAEKPS